MANQPEYGALMPTEIYHITHLRNLPSILQGGGLLSYNRLQREKIAYQNIAFDRIQDRRAYTRVPCGSGGVLHDYVPLYFASRSPMLFTIHRGNVASCPEGQKPVLHLVSTIEKIDEAGLDFVFTDGHAVVGYSEFFDSLEDLGAVDWDIMEEIYWRDTDEDGDRKRRRQAEFLIRDFLPWSLVIGIGVIDTEIKRQVKSVLQNMNLSVPVWVCRDWYY